MATHGMIDLETLGVEPDAVIMTVGAIKFDPYSNAEPHGGLYLRCDCLLYTSPSPRDRSISRMPSSA